MRKHLEEVGLDGDIAQYNEMGSLSGGQKVKVVIASALWNNPQVLVLGNFLLRSAAEVSMLCRMTDRDLQMSRRTFSTEKHLVHRIVKKD